MLKSNKPVKITESTEYPGMFYLEWSDGVLSEDFYNRTRAKDILKYYDLYRYNIGKQTEDMI